MVSHDPNKEGGHINPISITARETLLMEPIDDP